MNLNFLVDLETKYFYLQEIELYDLQSVINLRLNKKNNFLSPISSSIDDQRYYYQDYKQKRLKNSEIYFKVTEKKNAKKIIGLVRLTEIDQLEKFSWESLIISDEAPPYASLDVIFSIYKIGFEILKKNVCGPWEIPIKAQHVYRLHKKMGMAIEINKNNNFYNMIVTKDSYDRKAEFYKKLGYGDLKLQSTLCLNKP